MTRFFEPAVGYFLSLLGKTLFIGDMLLTKTATHFIPNSGLIALREELTTTDNFIECLSKSCQTFDSESIKHKFPSVLFQNLGKIREIFAETTSLSKIVEKLKLHPDLYADFLKKSPLSIALTMHALSLPASLKQALQNEFRCAVRIGRGKELAEGVQAKLIDKREPRWTHSSCEQIEQSEIASYFLPFSKCLATEDVEELNL